MMMEREAPSKFSTFPHKKVEDEHLEHVGIEEWDTTIYSV
jgi:hypothetical protein